MSLLALTLLYCLPVTLCNSTDQETILPGDTGRMEMPFFIDRPEDKRGKEVIDRENIDLDKDVDKVCNTLRCLDVILTNMSRDPPAGGGEQMLITIRNYNEACWDLLNLCKRDKLRVLNAAEDILTPGGPKFFDIDVDVKKMKERFQWNDDKMDELESDTKRSYDLWADLYEKNNNFN